MLFHDIIAAEQQTGTQIIAENESAIVFVPYFARYAYEVFVAPKKSHTNIATLSAREVLDFASVLKDVLVRFDNLWQMPFPYVMPLHQAPTDGGDYSGFHFHMNSIRRFASPTSWASRGPRSRWWQLSQRHVARREGGRTASARQRSLQRIEMTNDGVRDIRQLLGPVRRLHEKFAHLLWTRVHARH